MASGSACSRSWCRPLPSSRCSGTRPILTPCAISPTSSRPRGSSGVHLQPQPIRGPGDVQTALGALEGAASDGLLVINTPVINSHFEEIAAFALRRRLPSITGQTVFTRVGGLMAYGPSFEDNFRRAATYVDKILKGAKPGDLPVEQPTKFDLVINLKTAQALGLTIPPSVLQQATETIQ